MTAVLPDILTDWFARRGWSPHRHQLAMLEAARDGASALLIAPTGGGKTLAGFLPSLTDLIATDPPPDGLHTLYISPLKGSGGGYPAQSGATPGGNVTADPRRDPHR